MSNTMIQNPVAQVAAAMNRPVMLKDVAEKLGMPVSSVAGCLCPRSKMSKEKIELVRRTVDEMGYVPKAARRFVNQPEVKERFCSICGTKLNNVQKKYCTSCGKSVQQQARLDWKKNNTDKMREYRLKWYHKNGHGKNTETCYCNGCFHSREDEVRHMKYLREQGYSNSEIAKAIGRSYQAVLMNIGKQDPELSKQNVAMAQHIRAQKNAARKQYVLNKPIREYNAKVEAHNKMKAELALLQVDLLSEKPIIEKAAQTKIEFPMVNLATVQPTALQ